MYLIYFSIELIKTTLPGIIKAMMWSITIMAITMLILLEGYIMLGISIAISTFIIHKFKK